MNRFIGGCCLGLGLTLMTGTIQATPKRKVVGKTIVAKANVITEIQVIETTQRGGRDDSGRYGPVWTMWPDRVNVYDVRSWTPADKHDASLPVRAGALPPGQFQTLARYIQSSRLLDTETPKGASLDALISGDDPLLYISVVRGGKRKVVVVRDVEVSSSQASLNAWAVNRVVHSIAEGIEWQDVVGGRIDTGIDAAYDYPNSTGIQPSFSVLNAAGKEEKTIYEREDVNSSDLGSTRHFLPPGTYRIVPKKADAAGSAPSNGSSQPNLADWAAVPSTIVLKAGRFPKVHLIYTGDAEEKLVDAAGRRALVGDEPSDLDVIRFFLARGVSVDARSNLGWTALTFAAATGNGEAVRLLLDKGAMIDAPGKDGATALMHAADYDNVNIMRLLLAKGARVDAQDESGNTALMHCAASVAGSFRGNEGVALLLARKANVNLKNKEGKTALSFAADEKIKKLLQAAGAK